MRILYYDWDEFNGEDCRDAMRRLGHQVDVFKLDMKGFELTPQIDEKIRELVLGKNIMNAGDNGNDEDESDFHSYHLQYDLLFSFDFFPNISEACQKYNMPYISWVFDCPHYTLDSHLTNNSVNRIFVFDKLLYKRLLDKGVNTVKYSPLGVNDVRLSELCKKLDGETDGNMVYEHDVCFLGNLYDNEYNFYDQVNYLPPELKGYTDAVIKAQERVFGQDFFTEESIYPYAKIIELQKYIKFEQSGKYEIDYDGVMLDILRKKVTVNERHNILAEMGKRFDTVLYTMPGTAPIEGVCNLGVASYLEKMPKVFHRSKVNLNITLRSILSGIPLRVLDILAAGGFLITNYQAEIAQYFTDGEELVMAFTPEDMIQKTAYYLEHEDERKEIAINGQKKVFKEFAYTRLLPEVLEAIY
ncbi:spore maturation protein CgeB [Butyrivibrio proteoclasticus]|uniref:Spore maturation protein CgeB n=1 Tax=Butyrivibrio proteoclasticus TaxID=43305 RepID=A0A1I5Y6F7_9FIRM|nr:glycosyltransferase [Butyrivibrio proteoclasticus]SFQ39805.1 spore maturation protein CgeB [Butyrivibrio proteoclasticus]